MNVIRWDYSRTAAALMIHPLMMGLFGGGMVRRRKRMPMALDYAPRVSILKPLAGADDGFAQNLGARNG